MDEDRKSKTRRKNEDRVLQALGERLTDLTKEQIDRMDLPEEVMAAVRDVRKIRNHGARRRQIRHIGALLRGIDPAPILVVLENIRLGDFQKALAFKKIEGWRDELKAGNSVVLEEILRSCPRAERQRLTQLARNAWKESEEESGVKSSRALFKYLREIGKG